jgi:hypothetical protein
MKTPREILDKHMEIYEYVPEPVGIPEEEVARVAAEFMAKGQPIPLDYGWHKQFRGDVKL